jgi:hypothetical protein
MAGVHHDPYQVEVWRQCLRSGSYVVLAQQMVQEGGDGDSQRCGLDLWLLVW